MLPRLFQQKRERGVAILMSLGVLSLILLLAMGYAYSGQGGLQLSTVNNDASRASLLAEAGVQRCIGFLQDHFEGNVAPYSQFVEEDGRFYLVSTNSDSIADATEGAAEALSVAFPLGNFLDSTDLEVEEPGWVYVKPTVDTSEDGSMSSSKQTVTGRFAYAIINETGKFDPNELLDDDGTAPAEWDAEGYETRIGESLEELSLTAVLGDETLAHTLHDAANTSADRVVDGVMPHTTQWLSHSHLYRSVSSLSSATLADSVANNLFPWSLDSICTTFWDDYNSSPVPDDRLFDSSTERYDKIPVDEIGTTYSDADLYDFFLNTRANPARDDRTKYSAWLRNHRAADYTESAEVRRIAAHTAVNILDSADADSQPRVVYVDTDNDYELTSTKPANYEFCVIGDDGQHSIGEVQLSLELSRGVGSTSATFTASVGAGMFNQNDTAAYAGSLVVEYEVLVRHFTATKRLTHTTTIPATAWTSVPISTADDDANWSYTAPSDLVSGPSGVIDVDIIPVPFMTFSWTLKKVEARDGANILDVLPARQVSEIWPMVPIIAGTINEGETRYTDFRFVPKHPYFNGFDFGQVPRWGQMMDTPDGTFTVSRRPVTSDISAETSWFTGIAEYGDVAPPRNAPFTRVAELGSVGKGYGVNLDKSGNLRRGGSLRFWSYDSDHAVNHDGYLIDMFRDVDPIERGKVDLNTPCLGVLTGLFTGTASTPFDAAVSVKDASETKLFASVGELAGIVGLADDGISDETSDLEAEANVKKFIRFTTLGYTGYSYFTIIVVAQALHDTEGTELTTGESVEWDSSKYAVVRGERKLMAVVARNNDTNKFTVIRLEQLTDE